MMKVDLTVKLVENSQGTVVDSSVFDRIIGQEQAKRSIQFYVDGHQPTHPFPTLLFTGSHGLGKTMFSELVSKALFREFLEINCSEIKEVSEFMDIVYNSILNDRKPVTILFDEAHRLSSPITTFLLTLLNPNSRHTNTFKHNGVTLVWDLRNINVIFATTDAYRMFKPLRSRTEEIYFYPYSDDDLYKIVKLYCPNVDLNCSRSDLAMVCRARARDAFILSGNIKRYLSIQDDGVKFTQDDLNDLKHILGVMDLGLKRQEVELIQTINEHHPISASNLATKLMVNQQNIEEELEIRPRELGLIESSTRGRIITEKGINYLENLSTECV